MPFFTVCLFESEPVLALAAHIFESERKKVAHLELIDSHLSPFQSKISSDIFISFNIFLGEIRFFVLFPTIRTLLINWGDFLHVLLPMCFL